MFYSHEILTSRKYGVATVWLVATLGAKSCLKRINRKQIFDVDVSKACQTIVDPAAPLALRLQGNLLQVPHFQDVMYGTVDKHRYGLSRVYQQQCGYVLSDAHNAQLALRAALRTTQDAALDATAGKAGPEQLILQDDPSFLPEFAYPPPELLADLDPNFNPGATHSGDSQPLTPFGSQQSASGSHVGSAGGLILPTSSPVAQSGFRLEGDYATSIVNQNSDMLGVGDTIEIEDPDFTFGDDGEIVQLSPLAPSRGTTRATVSGNAGRSTRIKKEVEEELRTPDQLPDDDMDPGFPGEEDNLPEKPASSSSSISHTDPHSEAVESSESFIAPMRRRRVPRTIPADAVMEMRNKDLADWNANYLNNMKTAARQKAHNRALTQAKKNAEHYVWGSGLGNIGERMIISHGYNPFSMFVGDNLFEAITGISRKVTVLKRDRDSGIDEATQEESRRVRQKTIETEAARGADDDGFPMPLGDGDDDAVELPREAASALDEQLMLSSMPWNMSAFIRGSSAIPFSGRIDMISSASRGRHGSRPISTSPLRGRGQPLPFELQQLASDADLAGDEFVLPGFSSDSPDPEAHPETTSRLRTALSAEGENFITYMAEKISEKSDRAQTDAEFESNINTITFEELLPPRENTRIVACHGLMMILTLGSKGMLDIQQPEHFGDIHLSVSAKAKALQTMETGDGGESGDGSEDNEGIATEPVLPIDSQHVAGEAEERDEEMEDLLGVEEEGHFEEQFAAGHGDQEGNNIDSLYAD
ncbi:hypothetical protein yc1106_08419 [Curvularia clavata]|uniref:Rad21/Rec8-like protein N-terminal domain-containing protein n=1 Tax=Curvularia clavata TaxID=95742 RepID=A0A9Q9DWN4_CURCL|nr:hypothetical protein yc1106_08419 [Curvularia clavata]